MSEVKEDITEDMYVVTWEVHVKETLTSTCCQPGQKLMSIDLPN